jgi:hypothetical protein
MNKKLLFAFTMLSGFGFSQNFDASNEFAIGATQTMFMVDSSASQLETTVGNGVTWDYSNLWKFENGDRLYSINNNANTATYGANTNKVIDIQNILTTFIETNASGREIAGIEYNTQNATFGTIKINFNDDGTTTGMTFNKIAAMTYPFALNDNINDLCSGYLSSTSGFIPVSSASGTSTSDYDGMGTLKLGASTTINNVSRHHLATTINSHINFLTGVDIVLIIDQYDYYTLGSGNYLPEFSFVNVKLSTSGAVTLNTDLNFVLTSVDPNGYIGLSEKNQENFVIFPSPAKNTITVSSDKFSGNELFEISTLEGKVILNSTSNNINVSVLPTGMYVVAVNINGELIKQKFIKE